MKKNIAFLNFWPGFDESENIFLHALSMNSEFEYVGVKSIWKADAVVESVFPNHTSKSKHLMWIRKILKQGNLPRISFTGENTRPNLRKYDFAISFDYLEDERHFRLPLWALYTDYAGKNRFIESRDDQIDISIFHESRQVPLPLEPTALSVFMGNPTPERLQFIEKSNSFFQISGYGNYFKKAVPSKLKYQGEFRFNLCFENSIFPGYHTEKLLQAYAMGSVPLYFGHPTVLKDFNPEAFINLADFDSMDSFIEFVSRLSDEECQRILNSPLLTRKFDLSSFANFMDRTLQK